MGEDRQRHRRAWSLLPFCVKPFTKVGTGEGQKGKETSTRSTIIGQGVVKHEQEWQGDKYMEP